MRIATKLGAILFLTTLAASLPPAAAQTTVRSYRYALETRSQEGEYAGELSPAARVSGRRIDVETDAQGRRLRITSLRNGQKIAETLYRYSAAAKLPSEYDTFRAGEKTGVVRIQRDAAGQRVREDYLTAAGTLTGYGAYAYFSDRVEFSRFTAEGKKTGFSIYYYSASGVLTRATVYSNPDDTTSYIESAYDERTGQRTSSQQFNAGSLTNTRRFTYNADSDLVRMDVFSPANDWYAADEFADGLIVKRIYKLDNGTQEWRYAFDEKRWAKESALYINNALVCRLVYDRHPNGAAKRTLALGPNGDLWAEYPDQELRDLKRTGETLNGKPAIIHKKGNWW